MAGWLARVVYKLILKSRLRNSRCGRTCSSTGRWPESRGSKFGSDTTLDGAGEPWECAECYAFLASAAASHMTGRGPSSQRRRDHQRLPWSSRCRHRCPEVARFFAAALRQKHVADRRQGKPAGVVHPAREESGLEARRSHLFREVR